MTTGRVLDKLRLSLSTTGKTRGLYGNYVVNYDGCDTCIPESQQRVPPDQMELDTLFLRHTGWFVAAPFY